jgi:hypothetical protein
MLATEDIARVSPLVCDHINLHGRYYCTPSDAITRGELHNLRNVANLSLHLESHPLP